MIIDIHVHPQFIEPRQGNKPSQLDTKKLDIVANPRHFPAALSQTSRYYYRRNHVMLQLPEFINQMDEARIDKITLVNPAIKGIPVRPMNESVARLLEEYPKRFIGFAGFDPNNGAQAVQEIEYAVEDLGFSGIKTVASTLELDINDKAFYPCYAKAEELGIPILIHTGSVIIKGVRVKHVHPLMIDDVAFDFPDLRIICAHLGGWQYMDTINMLLHHSNVFADISFWPLNPFYVDIVPWSLLEKTVSDKILLGSDYPAGQTPKEAVEAAKKLPASESFREKILGKNASKMLGL
ncbi:MAG: amidohydrolase family protein [Candidatus Bathyarchaeota archaeon]|jgi:predicted TIM-barrel fold metal-dependent hydrolase|nr:amidohydrolase family protein [Candidatus Bathyarchaeota archaeon]